MANPDFRVKTVANGRRKCKHEPDVLHLRVFYYIQTETENDRFCEKACDIWY